MMVKVEFATIALIWEDKVMQLFLTRIRWKYTAFCVVIGVVAGVLISLATYWAEALSGISAFLTIGAVAGLLLGLLWRFSATFWMRFCSEEWRITEIETEILGQKWKMANSGSQRRAAWTLFVELATRVTTQSMPIAEGDDGAVLKSLYELFKSFRTKIGELEPSGVLPTPGAHPDTLETFALATLNQDLRPFLSKWHPIWDTWRASKPAEICTSWEQHKDFRFELNILQGRIRERALGLATIAGVSEGHRYL